MKTVFGIALDLVIALGTVWRHIVSILNDRCNPERCQLFRHLVPRNYTIPSLPPASDDNCAALPLLCWFDAREKVSAGARTC